METTPPHAHPRPSSEVGPPAGARRSGPWGWFTRGGWYLFVVVLSLGILSFVPFVHAAARTRRPLMWLWAVLYTAAVLTLLILSGHDVGGFIFALMVVAAVHSVALRQQVWRQGSTEPSSPAPAPVPSHVDPAVAAVLAARARRDEARRIAVRDPQMARELGIGRPDLSRAFDDGGLVDLNHAPPQAIATTCGIDLAVATAITDARANGIPFTTVDDVFSVADVPFPLWDRIRERAVVVTG